MSIDTGSSNLFVNTQKACQNQSQPANSQLCGAIGTYNANDSSTYNYLPGQFGTSYGDGTGATGDWATEDVGIGGATLKGQQIGIAYSSTTPEAVFGLGYTSNVAGGPYNTTPYDNVPASLVKQGFIKSNAFSLWLNDINAASGSVLFGGVDSAKYSGPLTTVPTLPEAGTNKYVQFLVNLDSVVVSTGQSNVTAKGNVTYPIPVLLDSGASDIRLPDGVIRDIYSALNSSSSANLQSVDTMGPVGTVIACNCALANTTQTIAFNFSGATISVPMSSLVLQIDSNFRNQLHIPDTTCQFGITPMQATNPVMILGQPFLRAAYAVYDLDNKQISLAQAVYTSKSDIKEIGVGKNSVPGAVNATGASPSSSTSPGASSTASPKPSSTVPPSSAAVDKMAGFSVLTIAVLVAEVIFGTLAW